jgi:hypothetical protein
MFESSTANNPKNCITIEVDHGTYILAEQLNSVYYRVSLHSHHSDTFIGESWIKPYRYTCAHDGHTQVHQECKVGGKVTGYIIDINGLELARKSARFYAKKSYFKNQLPTNRQLAVAG